MNQRSETNMKLNIESPKPRLRSLRRRRGSMSNALHTPHACNRAFTLTELLIAVTILVIVIIASAKIFGTASKITGIGKATSDVLTEAAAIEQRLRNDIKRMSHEGVLAIRNVAVRNNINGAALLNPELPVDAIIRADQLVFFATGVESASSTRLGRARNNKGQGTAAFVYYGHAFQLPDAPAFDPNNTYQGVAFDAAPNQPVFPWTAGLVNMVRTNFETVGGDTNGTNVYTRSNAADHYILQPGARKWLLARQTAILVDDDTAADNENGKTVYLGQTSCSRSIFLNDPIIGFSPQLRDARVDAAATELPEVRARILNAGTTWLPNQRQIILDQIVYYPRGERSAPSIARVDQALTNAVLGSGCSSFRVDWTYDLGVGRNASVNPNTGFPYVGISNAGTAITSGPYEAVGEIRWFGMDERDPETDQNRRGVYPFSSDRWPDNWDGRSDPNDAGTIYTDNIEFIGPTGGVVEEVNYVFGFNQTKPFLNLFTELPDETIGEPDQSVAYTPWPSALRITMTLHDPESDLKGGREFQFIIRLPKRDQ